jgi:hypothetical protein
MLLEVDRWQGQIAIDADREMAINNGAKMAIDDGDVIEVAASVTAVEQWTDDRGHLNLKSFM